MARGTRLGALHRAVGAAFAAALALGPLASVPAVAADEEGPSPEATRPPDPESRPEVGIPVPVTPADPEPAPEAAGEPGEGPKVGLEDLLRLPRGYGAAEVERKGGGTPSDWRARFAAARQELDDARKRLEEIDAELEEMSGSSSAWSVAAPGSQDPQSSPLSLRLRQDMKDQRLRIQEAERSLRALHVEADLAGVPEEWRE